MTPIIRTRPVHEDDAPFLRTLFNSVEEERLGFGSFGNHEKSRLLNTEYRAFQAHYQDVDLEKDDVILTCDDTPVGRMIVLQNSEEIRLAELMLIPELRGKGLGTALIQGLQAESQMSNRPLRVLVFKLNAAIRLYKRLGFYKIEENPTHELLEWTVRLQGSR